GWFSTFSITCFVIFIISTVIFIFFERQKHAPFIDFSLFRNRGFVGSSMITVVLNSAIGTTTVFNMYAQPELGLNAFQPGLVTVPYVRIAVGMIRLREKLSLRFGGKPRLFVGPLFPAIGIMVISLTVLPTDWYVGTVVVGFVICA